MPGTILVSVLGVEDLPSPSLPSSALSSESSVGSPFSLKLVMGRTEYQTVDKGDFSFPVMSVRENLKLIICDAEGNEISRSDVKTMVVVEKRSWDSFFPLEGGGRVHLKLQFILSAEEHKRIHEMREAVLKRKRAELIKSISKDQAAEKAPDSSALFVGEKENLPDRLILKAPVKDSFPVTEILGNYTERGKILVVPAAQSFQQLPEHQSEQDAEPPEHRPEVDSQQSDHHPKLEAQQPEHRPEVDSQQSDHHPEVDARPPEHCSEVDSQQSNHHPKVDTQPSDHHPVEDSQQPEHHPELDAQQAENHPKMEAIARTLKKNDVDVSDGLANQIDVDVVLPIREAIDPQMKRSEFLVSEDITVVSSSPEMVREIRKISSLNGKKHEKSPVSGVKKMISAFENISSQEPKLPAGSTTKSRMRRVERVEGLITEQATVGRTLPKSFSTGSLSGMKSPKLNSIYVEVQEEEKHCDVAADKKTRGSNQQFAESENDQHYEKLDPGNHSAAARSLYATELPDREKTNDASDVIQTKKVVTFCRPVNIIEEVEKSSSREAKESTPYTFRLKNRGELEEKMGLESFPKGGSSLVSESSSQALDATLPYYGKEKKILDTEGDLPSISKIEDKMIENPTVYGQSLVDYHESPSQRDCTIVKLESGFGSPGRTIREVIAVEDSDTKINLLAYFDAEQCLLGSHGNRIPRHVCITSGTKQLRDAIGCFRLHL